MCEISKMFDLLLLVCSLILLSACEKASIISSPISVNISQDHSVFLNCTATATYINWKVNGVFLNHILRSQGFHEMPTIDLNVTENQRRESLQVLGSPHSNNVNIVCVAVLQLSTIMFDGTSSKPALVLVQGLLESVSNLTVTVINPTTVLISWSPPFTLEGVPILGYNVIITNTTSGENETMLVEDTNLLYSIDHPDPENSFTVTVVPINEVGAGEPAVLTIASLLSDPTRTTQETHSTEVWLGNALSKEMTSSVYVIPSPSLSATQTTAGFVHITTVASVVIAIIVATVLAILGIAVIAVCIVQYFKQKVTTPPQDVLTVNKNPAYEVTVIQRTNTKKSSGNSARTHQYENVNLWGRQAL